MTVNRHFSKKNPFALCLLAFTLFFTQLLLVPASSIAATNLAAGKSTTESGHADVYGSGNITDGSQDTYWESVNNAFPQWVRVDLGSANTVNQVVLKLPSAWGNRNQTLSIQGSTNDSTYTPLAASQTYTFAAGSNTVTINFTSTSVRYVKIHFTANTSWPAGQLSELEVYNTSTPTPTPTPTTTPTPAPTPTPTPSGTYEAESAALTGGAKTNTDHTGYTGSGFVDGYWTQGATTTFTVNAATAGNYHVALKFGNASGSAKTLSIYVNGAKVKQTTLANLANWDTWSTKVETLTLDTGNNTIAYKYDTTDSGNVNLDNLQVAFTGPTSTPTATPTPTAIPTPTPTPTPTSTPTATPTPGTNLALNKAIVAGSVTQTYVAANANDGNPNTYWEGAANAYPNWIRVDLGGTSIINRVVVKLPASWGSRTQTLSVLGSVDDATYTTIVSSATYAFNPGANAVTIDFSSSTTRYVKLNMTANSGATGAQVAELEVYGSAAQTPTPSPTPTAAPSPTPTNINLALGKPTIVSSTESANYAGSNAVDGNTTTRWSSAYTDPQYFIVDLGSAQTVASVVLKWETAYARQFQIQTSTDNVSWTTVYSNYNGSGGINPIDFDPTTARYVKMYGIQRATAYGYSLYEFEVYGYSTESSTSTAVKKQQILNYLNSISGNHTLVGIENKDASHPTSHTDQITAMTGKVSSFWGGDFGFGSGAVNNRSTLIAEAKRQFSQGALVSLMYHACAPTRDEYCSWDDIGGGNPAKLSDAQFVELTTPGTNLYNAWINRLNTLSVYLQDLKDSGVVVVFRPFHEMNQCVFWWSCHKGPNGSARLYQITHDYLANTKGLDNIIWNWNVQDFSNLGTEVDAYNPGSAYFDMATLDVYNTGYTQNNYNTMLRVSGGKLIAVGECQFMPTASLLAQQNKWLYVMLWPDFISQNQSTLPALYSASNVLTLEEMPGWSFNP